MTDTQHPGISSDKAPRHQKTGRGQQEPHMLYQDRALPDEHAQTPPANDAGGGISAGTLKDASGTETGGGVDTPTRVEEKAEDTIEQQKPLNQGTSAYTGGGADNGSNL